MVSTRLSKKIFPLQKRLCTAVVVFFCAAMSIGAQTDSALPGPLAPAQTTPTPARIQKIVISGARVTKPSVMRLLLQIDTTMTCDSALFSGARLRLERTGLFTAVTVTSFLLDSQTVVSVYVREASYFGIDNAGLDLLTHKYGQEQFWWRLRGGIFHSNFRGMMERLSVSAYIWDDKYLGIGWTKPILATPYQFGISAGIRDFPYTISPYHRTSGSGRISVSRQLTPASTVSVGMSQIANQTHYRGIAVPDTSANRVTINLNRYRIDQSIHNYHEGFFLTGFSIDKRNAAFDPSSGWSIQSSLKTNAWYPDIAHPFIQADCDLRGYLPAFLSRHRFAAWIHATLRDRDAGELYGLSAGSENSIRGYPSDYFGLLHDARGVRLFANNKVCALLEYRWPIWQTPSIDMPVLSDFRSELKGFYYRFDAALIMDGGMLWNRIDEDPQRTAQYGLGLGGGVRIMIPTLGRSLCLDIVSGRVESSPWNSLAFYTPLIHAYIDLFF